MASFGGIYRDSNGACLGYFSDFAGITTSLHAELMAAAKSIEIAFQRNWSKLWLECDSSLVVAAFNSTDLVPWNLRNRYLGT